MTSANRCPSNQRICFPPKSHTPPSVRGLHPARVEARVVGERPDRGRTGRRVESLEPPAPDVQTWPFAIDRDAATLVAPADDGLETGRRELPGMARDRARTGPMRPIANTSGRAEESARGRSAAGSRSVWPTPRPRSSRWPWPWSPARRAGPSRRARPTPTTTATPSPTTAEREPTAVAAPRDPRRAEVGAHGWTAYRRTGAARRALGSSGLVGGEGLEPPTSSV